MLFLNQVCSGLCTASCIKLLLLSVQANSNKLAYGCHFQHTSAQTHPCTFQELDPRFKCLSKAAPLYPLKMPLIPRGRNSKWHLAMFLPPPAGKSRMQGLSIPWLSCLEENSVQGINRHDALWSFLRAVLDPICSANKNNLFHPLRQGSPEAQKLH